MQKTTTLKCQCVENNIGIIVIYFFTMNIFSHPKIETDSMSQNLNLVQIFVKKIFLTFKLGREMQRKAKDKKGIRTFFKEKK